MFAGEFCPRMTVHGFIILINFKMGNLGILMLAGAREHGARARGRWSLESGGSLARNALVVGQLGVGRRHGGKCSNGNIRPTEGPRKGRTNGEHTQRDVVAASRVCGVGPAEQRREQRIHTYCCICACFEVSVHGSATKSATEDDVIDDVK